MSERLNKILKQLNCSPQFESNATCGKSKGVLRVCVTGSAGQIAYALLPLIASGDVFGERRVVLLLLDIPVMMEKLEGVRMELMDCAYRLLGDVVVTDDPVVAFRDVDVCVFLGAFPRKKGMERKDLLERNALIFKEQGQVLNEVASRYVKVLVVGNPANTNCWILKKFCPNIPSKNFTSLSRLDQNRTVSFVARELNVNPSKVKNTIIWGNHSSTQFPDLSKCTIQGEENTSVKLLIDQDYYKNEMIPQIQIRGAAVIKLRGLSSSLSAARAVADHLRDWIFGTHPGEWVSMGVVSDGSYGIEHGLIFSFPVTIRNGQYEIVQGLSLDQYSNEMINSTMQELIDERYFADNV